MTRTHFTLAAAALALLTACGDKDCTASDCAQHCDNSGGAAAAPAPAASKGSSSGLSDFEQEVVSPILEDVRAGIRAWDDQGIGICKGNKECDEFLGTDAGELSEGKHMLQAVLRVPQAEPEGGWTVEFSTDCTITSTSNNSTTTSNKSYSKSYTVRYAGESKGYRLAPLYSIDSPNRGGSSECSWSLKLNHPDNPETITGSWKVPEAS